MARRDWTFQKHYSNRQVNLRVLLDMDGVLCDFEGDFLEAFKRKYPDEPYIELEDRDGFWLREQYEQIKQGITTIADDGSSSRSSSPHRRGRGRGRGRRGSRGRSGSGRSRSRSSTGRGTGRGRGRGVVSVPETEEVLLQRQENEMKEEVNSMAVEDLRRALCRAIELSPGIMLEVMRPAERQPGGYHPGPSSNVPDWCVCGHCREMPTQVEKKCCGKGRCVSRQANFDVLILDEGVLALARLYRRDVFVFEEDVDVRKANRHQAYRQFILWSFGRLGAGDRRVVPSCCVWKIRDKFPDAFGQYTGFVPSRIG